MNKLQATVHAITTAQGSTLVLLDYQDTILRAITLQPPLGLKVGSDATLIVHETRPVVSIEPPSGIANTLRGVLKEISQGEMLTRLQINIGDDTLWVLTDTVTFRSLNFEVSQEVYIAFKATDIAIEVNR